MLFWIYKANIMIHVVAGIIGLLVLIVPFLTKKGSGNHKRLGKVFVQSMLAVGWTGIAMALMIIFIPEPIFFPDGIPAGMQSSSWAKENVNRGLFLLNIAAIVLVAVRYSRKVLLAGKSREGLKHPFYMLELAMPALTGLVVMNVGLKSGEALYIAFAFIGTFLSFGYLKYVLKRELLNNEHIIEHFSGITGASIACVTAFAVTGADRLLGIDSFEDQAKLIFWLGPSVIGTVLAIYGHFKFRKQFKVKALKTNKALMV